jgi:hypothetical protein
MGKIDGGLRELLRGCVPTFHWTSVETGATARGVPDSNYLASGGIEGWVECKRTRAGRDTYRVEIQPEQAAWHHRRARLGGRSWIAVRRVVGREDQLWMVPGGWALEIRRVGLRAAWDGLITGAGALPGPSWGGVWLGGPAGWDWAAVAACLRAAPLAAPACPAGAALEAPERAAGASCARRGGAGRPGRRAAR